MAREGELSVMKRVKPYITLVLDKYGVPAWMRCIYYRFVKTLIVFVDLPYREVPNETISEMKEVYASKYVDPETHSKILDELVDVFKKAFRLE